MGKKGKDKKKGKGAEKTAAKTEKKLGNKLKKELKNIGEEDIESILGQLEIEEKKRSETTETKVEQPSRRINFSFLAHPDKDQLIMYGGEFFNGQKTFIYNDLFFYTISSNTWTVLKSPGAPPPRCGHQMVTTSSSGGQLWLFGGEFSSPTQTQFYHYRDLWVYHIAQRRWEKVTASNGPTARSGHRMVYSRKTLVLFGGFHDTLRDYKYHNDVHIFDVETREWRKLDVVGTPPAPRSACCMSALPDGRILVYGGYSKEKVKRDVDRGKVYADAFLLTPDKHDQTGCKWRWMATKLSGQYFSPRCSMPMTSTPNNITSYSFGGVFDVEDDQENISGTFYNDLLALDLEKLAWKTPTLAAAKKSKKTLKDAEEEVSETEVENDDAEKVQTVADDGVFKVTVGPSLSSVNVQRFDNNDVEELSCKSFTPSPRTNCGMAIKRGVLYLYGGMFEEGNKQVTLSDLYSLDLKKLDGWKVVIGDSLASCEWLGSDSESESDNEEDENEEEDEDESGSEVD